MKNEKFKLVAAIYIALIKDGKIFLLKRAHTGYQDGNYSLIGGHLNGNETLTKAAAREASEETGIKINPKDLKLIHVIHKNDSDERIEIIFKAEKWQGEPVNAEPERCSNVNWFPINQLPENISPFIKKAINDYLERIAYSEFGWK